MENERKKRLSHLLPNLFFGCNIPFAIIESEHFINFIQALDPQYTLPSRFTLASSILNIHYEEVLNKTKKEKIQKGVLLVDGWKNSAANSQNVVSLLSVSNDEHIFLDSWNFSTIRETGEALVEVVNSSIEIAHRKFNMDIYAVVTDNASNMKSMGRRIDIWHTTCNSHSGNLLLKPLSGDEFDQKVNAIVKDFRAPCLEYNLLTRGGRKMVLAGNTHWCSRRNVYRRCLQNVQIMRDIVNANENELQINRYSFKNEVIEALFDEIFEQNLTNGLLVYDLVYSLINGCQRKGANIAYATEMWLKLKFPVGNPDLENLLLNRLKNVINKYGLAANFLDPVYRGQRFLNYPDYMAMTSEFFNRELNENGLQQLQYYKDQSGLFRMLFERNYKSSSVFWRLAKHRYPELNIFAEKLLNIPASTGELERVFSQWAHVHSTKRNRLRSDRSAKLSALYYALKSKFFLSR